MAVEAFKFDKLIAVVKELGTSRLFRVRLIGMDDELDVTVASEDHVSAAYDVLSELTFASHHPHQFFNKRTLEAKRSGEEPGKIRQMIDLANEAVSYAERNKGVLEKALLSVERKEARKIGG